MKGIILFMLSAFSLTACCNHKDMSQNEVAWYVKNSTDNPINIARNTFIQSGSIMPGDSMELHYIRVSVTDMPFFEMLYDVTTCWRENTDKEFHVLSVKGAKLKTWHYIENKEPNKQFFNERYWKFEKKTDKRTIGCIWVFEIIPEDIIQINEE